MGDQRGADGRRAARAELATVSTGSWSEMAPRLGLRLEVATGPGRGAADRRDERVAIRLGPGVRAGVVADLTHAVLPISRAHTRAWGRHCDQVVARARANTRAAAHQVRRLAPDDGPLELVLVAGGWCTSGLAADLPALLAGPGPTQAGPTGAQPAGVEPPAAPGRASPHPDRWALLVVPTPTTLVVASAAAPPPPEARRAVAHHLAALVEEPARPVIRYHPGGNMDIFTIFGWWKPPPPPWRRSTDLAR